MTAITFTESTAVHLPDTNGENPTDETFTLPAGTYKVIGEVADFLIIMDDPDGCNWMARK